MHKECQGKSPGTSRNVDVMVKLDMVSAEVMKITRGFFVLLQLFQFFNHSKKLAHDQASSTKNDSCCER